jgi:hypothetical protein
MQVSLDIAQRGRSGDYAEPIMGRGFALKAANGGDKWVWFSEFSGNAEAAGGVRLGVNVEKQDSAAGPR